MGLEIMNEARDGFQPVGLLGMFIDILPTMKTLHDKHGQLYEDFHRSNITRDHEGRFHLIDFSPSDSKTCGCQKGAKCTFMNKIFEHLDMISPEMLDDFFGDVKAQSSDSEMDHVSAED